MHHTIKTLSVLHVVIALLSSFVLITPALGQKTGEAAVTRPVSPPIAPPISRKAVAVLQTKLAASDGSANDFLGGSVAVSGDTAVVGASGDDNPITDAGSAYVFVRTGSTWTEQQKLVASDAAASDHFGSAVAISGDTIVVGAVGSDSPNTGAGAAYVFVRTGSTWTEQQKLVASDQAPLDNFGVSVAIVGDTIIVGANLSDSPVSNTGAAYVFTRTGSTWTQQQKLTASDAATNERFGTSTALSGETAVIGASGGGVYVFVRTGSTWTEQQKLVAASRTSGSAVAISGDTVVVRCGSFSTAGGALCVFGRTGTVWSQQQELPNPDPLFEDPDGFGFAIAIDGNTIVTGAPGTSFVQEGTGAAYIYVRTGSTWHEHQRLLAPDAASFDGFGNAAAISGSNVLIGSFGDNNSQEDSGSVYVYQNIQGTSILPGQLLISEFRLHGPNGDNDEFVELYNNTDSAIVVDPADGSSGFALVASDGQTRFVVRTGTVIPARGHLLAANTPSYSLRSYAVHDIFLNPGIPVNTGIALFNTSNPANFNQANRLDAVGPSSETNALFREGGGYAPFNIFVDMQFSFLRDLSSGRPADTQDNQADFRLVGATFFVRADARYGYPSPENLASPVERNAQFVVGLLDPSQSASAVPNRVREFSSSTPCSAFGTLSLRRTLTNNTGTAVTRLRFRVTSITTATAPSGTADLRPISSVNTTVVVAGTPHTVLGTTVETAGEVLLNNCGGLNSSLAVPAVTPLFTSKEPKGDSLRSGSPAKGGVAPEAGAAWNEITLDAALDAGASLDVQFLLGVQQTGAFRFFVNIEALP